MKKKFILPVITAGIAALGTQVFGFGGDSPVGLSVRAGVDFPVGNRGGNSTIGFGGGAEYKIWDLNNLGDDEFNAAVSISADYYTQGRRRNNNGETRYNIPVLVNIVGQTDQFFYHAGAGVGFGSNRNLNNSSNRNSVNFAYRLGGGYEFGTGPNPFFVEADFWGSSRSELNVIAAYIGVRL